MSFDSSFFSASRSWVPILYAEPCLFCQSVGHLVVKLTFLKKMDHVFWLAPRGKRDADLSHRQRDAWEWSQGPPSPVEEVVLATDPQSSFCGSTQCLLIGNVTWEVDVEDKEERERETKVERSCANKRMKMNARATSWVTHGDEIYFVRQHNPWAMHECATSENKSLHHLRNKGWETNH